MLTKLVRIGNSRGVRLPKPLIEEAGLTEDVELRVREGDIIISRARSPREGWAEAASELVASGGDMLLDAPTQTRFDREDWTW
jgi:antitoxin MazE